MSHKTSEKQALDWRLIVYNLLLVLLSPLLLLYLIWRIIKGKSAGLAERLGFMPADARELAAHDDPVIWIQACSVGEVAAVEPVIRLLREWEPLVHIVLSTTTTTGRKMAQQRKLELEAITYFPYDLPGVVQHALDAIKPDLLVTVDTELWPNIFAAAKSRGIATAVINGRISDKAFPKDKALGPLMRWTLGNIDNIMAQSEKDAERFRILGAPAARVSVLGNAKFDEPTPNVSVAEASKLRLELGLVEDLPVLVAGSTREGEEEKVLDAFELLRKDYHDLQLIIAPRHPERGEHIETLVRERGFAPIRRSEMLTEEQAYELPTLDAQVRVIILDTIGELTKVYALASVVFVGGSLVPWGGHNILQPIAQQKPTLMGPYMHNQQDLADIALQFGAVVQVRDAVEFAAVVKNILDSPGEQELLAAHGSTMMGHHSGAALRYAQALSEMLPERPGGRVDRFGGIMDMHLEIVDEEPVDELLFEDELAIEEPVSETTSETNITPVIDIENSDASGETDTRTSLES